MTVKLRKLFSGTDGGQIHYPAAALIVLNPLTLAGLVALAVFVMPTIPSVAAFAFVLTYAATFALESWRTSTWPEVYREAGYTPGVRLAARLALTYAVCAALSATAGMAIALVSRVGL
jgi:hypothetical protein